jgi:NADH dehydrogenase
MMRALPKGRSGLAKTCSRTLAPSSRSISPRLAPNLSTTCRVRQLHHLSSRPKLQEAASRTKLPNHFFTRALSDESRSPRRSSWLLGALYKTAAWMGISITVIGVGVIGFFIFDASTYKEHATQSDINVSELALQPRRGGPKNLPIAEVFIGDSDPERAKDGGKPRLVILGSGWGSVALLKELNPDDYHVTVISPTNYFLFTPMLPSATVGTLEMRSLVEPIRRIISRVHGHFIRAKAEDVEFSHKLVEVSQLDARGEEVRF